MNTLHDLLSPWFEAPPIPFQALCQDSREIQHGDLFIALLGHQCDGRQFIEQAKKNGAAAVLCHTADPTRHGMILDAECPVVYFFDLCGHIGQIAHAAYPYPVADLNLVGVTGTNGKTSVTHLLAQLSHLIGEPAAILGTVGNGLWGDIKSSKNTTSDSITLARLLLEYHRRGVRLAALEVSSHGLVQKRVHGIDINVAVFTNLTHDHLDYHGNMHNYALAKRRLFDMPSVTYRIFNIDDPIGMNWLAQYPSATSKSYSMKTTADYYMTDVVYSEMGVQAVFHWPGSQRQVYTTLLGAFNLSNLMAALASLHCLGYDMNLMLDCVAALQPIAGRMERFKAPHQPMVVVDYAHTPDALKQALLAIRAHCQGKLWCVFGCGGERDVSKRPVMARIAQEHADAVCLTADNPRTESVQEIIMQMQQGMTHQDQVMIEVDRQQAIAKVIAQASSEDVVLVAGKGHELYQDVMGVRQPYDERQFVSKLVAEAL
jgi:UDP-N-acetylmuramoyl-L-alanyl-D-glutamate--2,6-diaminopimelate ligase